MKNALSKLLLSMLMLISVMSSNAQTVKPIVELDSKIAFKAEMVRLWIDNVYWTRQSILCLTDRLPGAEETIYRLMKNQEDMGAIFTKYYGKKHGDEFCELISSNTSNVVSIIRSTNNRNTLESEKEKKRMLNNITAITNYLSHINPYWNNDDLNKLISMQAVLMNSQIEYRMSQNYDADIKNVDKTLSEAFALANFLADGIILQFPERFK